ncbi:hypothetical protein ACQPXH_27965 [Nocardia sp. CA-135953]|uniref:hypothetical protein n=1 Tax=Nocardia sp. CA-135953 TaxID=3239978 RepID=UPI003D969F2A
MGMLFYPIVMVAKGRAKEVHPAMWALMVMYLGYFFFLAEWVSGRSRSRLSRGRAELWDNRTAVRFIAEAKEPLFIPMRG